MKLKHQIHLLVKYLSAILPRCWWHNIDMVMWFCLSVMYLLVDELRFPNLDSRYITRRGIDIQFFTGTGIVKKHHTLNWGNRTFGFYDPLCKKCLSYFLLVLYFCIVILQTLFLALCQNPFNGFFSMMNQIESIFRIILRAVFAK